MASADAINQHIHTLGTVDDAVLTTQGGVIGALALSGIEPASVSDKDRHRLTQLLRNIVQRLPLDISLSQYYFHQDDAEVHLKPRDNKRAQLVSSRRQNFLNKKRKLNAARLYWVLEVAPEVQINSLFSLAFMQQVFNALFDSTLRKTLKRTLSLSNTETVQVEWAALNKQIIKLKDTLNELDLRLSFVSYQNTALDRHELWGLQKALVNLNPDYLSSALKAPIDRWDAKLSNGDVTPVLIDGDHYLKVAGEQAVYARIASIVGCGSEYVPEAAFCNTVNKPVLEQGNYLFFNRFTPYSKQKTKGMVADKEQDLFRSQLKVSDMLTGNASVGEIKQRINDDQHLKDMMEELEEARYAKDTYGTFTSMVVIFDTDIHKLKDKTKRLKTVLENAEFTMVWEGVGLLKAWERLLIGYPHASLRDMDMNTSKVAALSLAYKSSDGLPYWWLGKTKEEAIYILESDDGVPFYYTPFVGDKCLVIGVGPTRSGKTFLKNCIATHFNKIGGMYCALDIDRGTEPLAAFFKEEGAVFRLEGKHSQGFNPFQLADGEDDTAFISHMLNLVQMMIKTNDAPEMQTFSAQEQQEVDAAILKTIRLKNTKHRHFSGMLAHCSTTIKNKLARFQRGNVYGHLFDNDVDAIGYLDKPFSVYNTEGVKDNPDLAQLVNTEIFFRSVRLFENPTYREVPKFLEVDECQYVLSQRGAADFLIAKARTWFKHGGGMGFWTQSPKHYSDLAEWGTLRSAATTFVFMPDMAMEADEYQIAFPFLTKDDCDIIGNLKRNQQAYIKQPAIGVSKVVNLYVEAEQYVIATSRPHESALAQRILKQEPDVDIAISRIVNELNMEESL